MAGYSGYEEFYEVLGLDPRAGLVDIRAAYKNLSRKNHPDKGGDLSKFQKINEAHEALTGPDTKAEYDVQRRKTDLRRQPRIMGPMVITLEELEIGGDIPVGELPGMTVTIQRGEQTPCRKVLPDMVPRTKYCNGSVAVTIELETPENRSRRLEHNPLDIQLASLRRVDGQTADLAMQLPVSLSTALCGDTLHIQCIDGTPLDFQIAPSEIQPGYKRVLRGGGLPQQHRPGERGDLLISFEIELPKTVVGGVLADRTGFEVLQRAAVELEAARADAVDWRRQKEKSDAEYASICDQSESTFDRAKNWWRGTNSSGKIKAMLDERAAEIKSARNQLQKAQARHTEVVEGLRAQVASLDQKLVQKQRDSNDALQKQRREHEDHMVELQQKLSREFRKAASQHEAQVVDFELENDGLKHQLQQLASHQVSDDGEVAARSAGRCSRVDPDVEALKRVSMTSAVDALRELLKPDGNPCSARTCEESGRQTMQLTDCAAEALACSAPTSTRCAVLRGLPRSPDPLTGPATLPRPKQAVICRSDNRLEANQPRRTLDAAGHSWTQEALFAKAVELGFINATQAQAQKRYISEGKFDLQHYVKMHGENIAKAEIARTAAASNVARVAEAPGNDPGGRRTCSPSAPRAAEVETKATTRATAKPIAVEEDEEEDPFGKYMSAG